MSCFFLLAALFCAKKKMLCSFSETRLAMVGKRQKKYTKKKKTNPDWKVSCTHSDSDIRQINNKLTIAFLICDVIYFAHLFLSRLLFFFVVVVVLCWSQRESFFFFFFEPPDRKLWAHEQFLIYFNMK